MSQLSKGAKEYARNINKEAKSINACAIICLSADVPQSIKEYVTKSGAPVGDSEHSSNAKKIAFFRSVVLPFFPSCSVSSVGGVVFNRNKERAATFDESTSAEAFRNCGTLLYEDGAKGANGLKTRYFYRELSERKKRIKQDLGAAGRIYETDASGNVIYDVIKYREYVCARGGVYTLQEARRYYFEALGVPAAIAAEAEQEAAEKAAAAVMRAEQAKARAEAAAVKALENAKKLQAAAASKAEAAEQEQSAQGMTAAEAQKIEQAKAEAKAAKEAEKTENESRKKGELSKKPCKNTMKQAAKELHNYERVQK